MQLIDAENVGHVQLKVTFERWDFDVFRDSLKKDQSWFFDDRKGCCKDQSDQEKAKDWIDVVDDMFGHIEIGLELVDQGRDDDDYGT